jgi:cytochrome c peroxidase
MDSEPKHWLLVGVVLATAAGVGACGNGGGGVGGSGGGAGGATPPPGNGNDIDDGLAGPPPPPPLRFVRPIEVADLEFYVQDREAAVTLGKALFWDMQVGSDGIMACASCHFHAGADPRIKNQISPGLKAGDTLFGNPIAPGAMGFAAFGTNYTLQLADFPLHRRANPESQSSPITHDTNDVVSSQGVVLRAFERIDAGKAEDLGEDRFDPVFNVHGINVRRVEPVNSPSVINAVFNFANFLDGRANNFFNGSNSLGPADATAGIWVNDSGQLVKKPLNGRVDEGGLPALAFSSLASQATEPPVSDLEMSWRGRTWADIGRKMLNLTPLGKQQVHPQDSVLGPLANPDGEGLITSYEALIQQAFHPRFWNPDPASVATLGVQGASRQVIRLDTGSATLKEADEQNPRTFTLDSGAGEVREVEVSQALVDDEFELIEANFVFFFALAVQLYQSTLISDETPFDRFQDGDEGALTASALRGMDIFHNEGRCSQCHAGSLFTNAAVDVVLGLNGMPLEGVVERMAMPEGEAFYDSGFYNIAMRPLDEDVGRGGTLLGLNNPANDNQPYPLSFTRLAFLKRDARLPDWLDPFVQPLPGVAGTLTRTAVDGAHKTPGLRNVELTAPYFRNGEAATLMQAVDLYVRGGNFPTENSDNLDHFIATIPSLLNNEQGKRDLVEFMLHLTDERVRFARAPFDHPQIFVPHGHDDGTLEDMLVEIPASGADGRDTPKLPFLNADPFAGNP